MLYDGDDAQDPSTSSSQQQQHRVRKVNRFSPYPPIFVSRSINLDSLHWMEFWQPRRSLVSSPVSSAAERFAAFAFVQSLQSGLHPPRLSL